MVVGLIEENAYRYIEKTLTHLFHRRIDPTTRISEPHSRNKKRVDIMLHKVDHIEMLIILRSEIAS